MLHYQNATLGPCGSGTNTIRPSALDSQTVPINRCAIVCLTCPPSHHRAINKAGPQLARGKEGRQM